MAGFIVIAVLSLIIDVTVYLHDSEEPRAGGRNWHLGTVRNGLDQAVFDAPDSQE